MRHFPAGILVHIWCAPTCRFHTKLCKFLRNISTNICGLGERTDLTLGEVSSLFIFNRITISWLNPLNAYGFRFIFLLRDYENDLYPHMSISSHVNISMISVISRLSLKLYLDSLVYHRNIFGSPSKVFGNLRKVVGNLRKIIKNAVISMFI